MTRRWWAAAATVGVLLLTLAWIRPVVAAMVPGTYYSDNVTVVVDSQGQVSSVQVSGWDNHMSVGWTFRRGVDLDGIGGTWYNRVESSIGYTIRACNFSAGFADGAFKGEYAWSYDQKMNNNYYSGGGGGPFTASGPFLRFTGNPSRTVPFCSGTHSFDVASQGVTWNVITDSPSWIHPSAESGRVDVQVDANPGADPRDGLIILRVGQLVISALLLEQHGAPVFSIRDDETHPDARHVVVVSDRSDYSVNITGMRFGLDGQTWTEWARFEDVKKYQLPSLGSFTIHVQYRDAAGNTIIRMQPFTSSWSFLLHQNEFDEGSGVLAGIGEIELPGASDSNTVFSLSSSIDLVSVPAEVVVPAGADRVAFDVIIGDDALLQGSRNGFLYCVNNGIAETNQQVFELHDSSTAILSVELPERIAENGGVFSNAGTVRVSRSVDADVIVLLDSSNTQDLTVPATVVIPMGAAAASFDLTAIDNTRYDGMRNVTVTAAVVNWTPGNATVAVDDDDMWLSLSMPEYVSEGWGICSNAGAVRIPYPAPAGGLTVALIVRPDAVLDIPDSVTIPAGAVTVAFDIEPIDNDARDGVREVTVTAENGGWTPSEQTVTVYDNQDGLFEFSQDAVYYYPGTGLAVLTVHRDAATSFASVDYRSVDDTLVAGTHYQAVSGTLHFAAGETEQTMVVPILLGEPGRFAVQLENPLPHAGLDRNSVVMVQIVAPGSLAKHVLDGESGVKFVDAGDMTGDGNIDVIGTDGNSIVLWKNIEGNGRTWVRQTVTDDFESDSAGINCLHAADVTGDGNLDVLVAGGNRFVVFKNLVGDGSGWTQQLIADGPSEALSISAADIDGDGTLDLITSHRGNGGVAWWANSAGDASVWTPNAVENHTYAYQVVAIDLDGDGDLDLVDKRAVATWWENVDGQGIAWRKHSRDEAGINPQGGAVADIDADGNSDFIGSDLNRGVNWFRNTDCQATLWTRNPVPAPSIARIDVADMNLNGRIDIVFAAYNRIGWMENVHGDGTVWIARDRDAESVYPRSIMAVDIDRDGDPDILSASPSATMLAWWENLGAPLKDYFCPKSLIEGETESIWMLLPQAMPTNAQMRVHVSDVTRLTAPSSVDVIAGRRLVVFDIHAVDDALLNGPASIEIEVLLGDTKRTVQVIVRDNDVATLSLELPAVVMDNAGVLTNAGILLVSRPVDADMTVNLRSSAVGVLQVPPTVTLPAGCASVGFDLTPIDDGQPHQERTILITASMPDWDQAHASLVVRGIPRLAALEWRDIAQPQVKGRYIDVMMTARDQYGDTLTSFNESVTLQANGAGGSLAINPDEIAAFQDGIWEGLVRIDLTDGAVVLSALMPGYPLWKSRPFQVRRLAVANLAVFQSPGTRLMTITYDVESAQTDVVAVRLMVRSGAVAVNVASVTGDIGEKVSTGSGKTIVWDAGADWSGNFDNLIYEVAVNDGTGPPPGGDPTALDWDIVSDRWVKNIYANGQITMSDRFEGLMWPLNAGECGAGNRAYALSQCDNFSYAGHADWYLPKASQLTAMHQHYNLFTAVSTGYYWSSEPAHGWPATRFTVINVQTGQSTDPYSNYVGGVWPCRNLNTNHVHQVALPGFDKVGGVHSGTNITVTVACATEGAILRYTTDGSEPSPSSASVSAGDAVSVPVPGILKARAWKPWMSPSPAARAYYMSDGGVTDRFLVIDLSGGAQATNYPVSYLSEVPSNGWSDVFKTSKLVLRRIPAGSFMMGSPVEELERSPNEEPHEVTLPRDFYIGVFEVTQRQWELVTGTRPSFFSSATYYRMRPVENVLYSNIRGSLNWPVSEAVDENSFMGRLRARTGLATVDLPTEAQWEYACRAGTTTSLNNGQGIEDGALDVLGRYRLNHPAGSYLEHASVEPDSGGTAIVGGYEPNAWGLYDMHGNVAEWCLDSLASKRISRGGDWRSFAGACRSAARSSSSTQYGYKNLGLRIAVNLP